MHEHRTLCRAPRCLQTITQTGGTSTLVWGECDPHTLHPDLGWLRKTMTGPSPPKMVVLCNPCNPTGELVLAAHWYFLLGT